jgi:DNA-binding response OmpR family regulator
MPLSADSSLQTILPDVLRRLDATGPLPAAELYLCRDNDTLLCLYQDAITGSLRIPAAMDDICALIRRSAAAVSCGPSPAQGWQLRAGELSNSTQQITLNAKEEELLQALMAADGEAVSRDQLLQQVWHYAPDADTNTLETHMYRLRQKLQPLAPAGILTTEAGYCWSDGADAK